MTPVFPRPRIELTLMWTYAQPLHGLHGSGPYQVLGIQRWSIQKFFNSIISMQSSFVQTLSIIAVDRCSTTDIYYNLLYFDYYYVINYIQCSIFSSYFIFVVLSFEEVFGNMFGQDVLHQLHVVDPQGNHFFFFFLCLQ